jgi:Protein of unknown function (DUF3237)
MGAPEVEHESFMTLSLTLRRIPIGATPYGTRVEVPFEGTATSTLWDGERAVYGIDHITLSATGTSCIDVHVIISGDDEVITYRGNGRSTAAVGVREGVTFETASERLGWLNDIFALGKGTRDGNHLLIELFRITT